MGILLLIGVFAALAFLFAAIHEERWRFAILGILIFISTMVIFNIPIGQLPIEKYPYEAKVTLSDDKIQTTINFSSFLQDSNKITINQYCTAGRHWTDFQQYDVINKPLIIVLLDNDDKFIYKNRLTDEIYGETANMGTQP